MAENNIQERELPHNREAELSVIGSVLSDANSVSASAEIIKPEDFYYAANREIYAVVMDLFNENIPIDIVTVSDRLAQADRLDGIGGITYLSNAVTSVPTTGNVEHYARIIREKSVLRKLIRASSIITETAYSDSEGNIEKILQKSEDELFKVSSSKESQAIVPIQDVLMTAYQDMVENSINQGKITGIPTGFNELNNRTGGFHGGELIIVAGRPGMGKSSFAVNIAEYASIEEKITVAIFNLEMSKTMLVNRILCSQAYVDSRKIRLGDFDEEDWQQIGGVVDRIAMAPLYIDDTAAITVSEIKAKCRRLKQTKNLGLIVIDYLQLIEGGGKESRQQEISEISRSLKILAKELDVPVIALSQLSRAVEQRSDKRPMLSDLRESGTIEQDADIVMFLYRDDYYTKEKSQEPNVAECIVAKHRSGSTGTFKLGWKGQYTKFVNIDYSAKEE